MSLNGKQSTILVKKKKKYRSGNDTELIERQFQICVRKLKEASFELHPWQIEGVRWMLEKETDPSMRGGLLCDEMGLGKTIEAIGVMAGNPVTKTLLIMPGSLMQQWKVMIQKIFPEVEVFIHHGSSRITNYLEMNRTIQPIVVITSYGLTYGRKNREFVPTVLHKIYWDRIILDECHQIRNRWCRCSSSVKKLTSHYRWALTGTPIQNGMDDLMSIFEFFGKSKKYIKNNIKDLYQHYLLRRSKKMVINDNAMMPSMDCTIHKIDFDSDVERELYRRVRGEVKQQFKKLRNYSFHMNQIFELLLRLRQSCIYPELVLKASNIKYGTDFDKWDGTMTKLQQMANMIAVQDSSDRTIVFCHFREEMRFIQHYLKEKGFGVEILSGSLSLKQKNDLLERAKYGRKEVSDCLVEKKIKVGGKIVSLPDEICNKIFEYAPPIDVLVIQIQAGGVGLNLQTFNQVYFSSPHWNPSLEDQAICRAYRLGQTKKVHVHKMVMIDGKDPESTTIEEKVLRIQERKRKTMFKVLQDRELLNNGNPTVGNKIPGMGLSVTDFHMMFS